jgi:type I restriction-modification system DNA methylase subunit
MTTSALVQKLWNYCNILRDDGLSYGDYVEQLTYLLFLKMADAQSKPPFNKPSTVPAAYVDRAQERKLKSGTLFGIELVDSVTRLCAMNLLLHGIGSGADDELPVVTKDALAGKHGEYDLVLANPPFGKKSSVTIVNEEGEQKRESLVINRDDFWSSTPRPTWSPGISRMICKPRWSSSLPSPMT